MVAVAATLFAVNASVVKVIEHTGFDAQRLTQVRSTGAFVGLALVVLATRREAIRVTRRQLMLPAAGVACLSYTFYVLVAERGTRTRDPISLLAWGFAFASLFWAVVEPWWSFPSDRFDGSTSLLVHLSSIHAPLWLLVAWMVVLGSI